MQDLEVINLLPKFLAFFDRANHENVDIGKRWRLWQQHYNFTGLPPGYEEEAKDKLNKTWKKYQENINSIKYWQPDEMKIKTVLKEIKTQLDCQETITFTLLFFVGFFDNNAFVAPNAEGKPILCLPIEQPLSQITIVHELTHIVHAKVAGLDMNWQRPLADLILQEGLALHMSKQLVPGKNDASYIEMDSGSEWLQACYQKETKIIEGIKPYLAEEKNEVLNQFVFGDGTSGLRREAYFVGWEFVKSELNKGKSLSDLAAIKQNEIIEYVQDNL